MVEKLKESLRNLYLKFKTSRFNNKKILIPSGIILFVIFIYFFIFFNLPTPYQLKNFQATPLSTHILDRNGKLLFEIYRDQNRTPIKLKDLPPYIAQATIAIEDKNFYHHGGISLVSGILRAVRDMIISRSLQGGSTITQQLVKNALLSQERTIRRKAREIILAMWTEEVFSKDQILEMYLNQIPYGGASYGIEEAAKRYFGKNAKDLTLVEAATLAGLPQAPSYYSPYNDPNLTIQRRNEVLKALNQQNYINKSTYESALNTKMQFKPLTNSILAPHFVFYVRSQLEKMYGVNAVEEGGLNVYTTLDLNIQEQAEKVLKEELAKIADLHVTNGAILVTRPPTGEILAMVGSVDYFATPSGSFNVTTALRQPGSSIKPLNYGIGLERRLVTPATVFLDVPTCFEAAGQPAAYCPVNYDRKFHGPVQLRFALGNSFNIPAVKMLAINGVANFVASASAFTISTFKDPSHYGLALTLGGGEVRMTEMAQAYSTFANRGVAKKLNAILKIQDKYGHVLYQFKDPNYIQNLEQPLYYPNFLAIVGSKALSPESTFLISHILLDNNARSQEFGASSALVIPGKAVSVKTGTTDDKRDNWTIGYTPNFLTAVWVGNNDNSPMNQYLASGITGAAPIWNRVMSFVLRKQPDLWPIKPDDVVGKQVCWDTGTLASQGPDGKDSCPARFEYFISGTEPTATPSAQETVAVDKSTGALAPASDTNVDLKQESIIKDPLGSIYCIGCNHDHDAVQNVVLP